MSKNIKEARHTLHYHQLFKYSSKLDKFLIFIACISAILSASGLPASIILFGRLADSFVYFSIALQETENNKTLNTKYYDENEFMRDVEEFGIGSFFIGCTRILFCYLMMITISRSATSQVNRMKLLYFKSLLHQEIPWFDTYHGDLTTQAGEALSKLEDAIGQKFILLMFFFFECAVSLIVAVIWGWKLTLVVLSLAPFLIICSIIFNQIASRLESKESAAYSKAALLAEETFSSIRTVTAFGGESTITRWYNEKLLAAQHSSMNKCLVLAIAQAFVWAFDYGSYSLGFWFGVQLLIQGREDQTYEYEPSVLLIVFFCTMMGAMAIGQALPYWDALNSSRLITFPIIDIIDRVPLIDSFSTEGLMPTEFNGFIEIRNVSFRYPARPDIQILQKVNLSFKTGEKVAIVGSSGCGKSTIIHLIERFYDPDEGEVLIDGTDIRQLNLRWVRERIACVTQEPVLFATSIRNNISLGSVVTDAEVMDALKLANAAEFVVKLPNKISTMVGDRGSHLSGGQKQKIALARAFITNPKVLLLDEATAALDGHSESLVQAALDETGANRTTIIVAHRLQTIRNCDRIIVLDHGKVTEVGNHEKLMKLKGIYYGLVKSQIVEDIEEVDVDSELESQKLSELLTQKRPKRVSILTESRHSIDEAPREKIKPLSRIIGLNKPEWWRLILGAFGSLGFGFTIPCYALLFGEIMGVLSMTNVTEARDAVNFYSVLFLFVAVWAGICVFLQQYMFSTAGEYLTTRLRVKVMAAILKQETSWFDDEDNTTGALCTRLSSDASNVKGATGTGFGILLQSFGSVGISLFIAVILVWKQALVSSFMVPFICLATFLESRFVSGEIIHEMQDQETSAHIAVEAVSNIKTIASLCAENIFYEKYKESLNLTKSRFGTQQWRGLLFGFSQAIETWSYAVSLWYGGYLIKNEGVQYDDVFKVGELLIFGALMIGQSVAFAPNYSKGLISATKLFDLIDRKPKIHFNENNTLHPNLENSSIEFKHVKFSYPTRLSRVLRDFNCEIKHGQTVALIGASGSGKSTCIQLLERFYEAVSGEVLYAKQDIKKLNLHWLRSQFGLVPQEPVLFNTTLADNIAFGDNTRQIGIDEIIAAAKKANIHKFIAALPKGYETELGKKGTQLSGGQKQRIAIARALIRNPKVLLLDEATSALDAESEKIVQAALDEAMVNRTCIVIAHRLITIQDADKIVVVHSGHVVEEGTHQQLMANKGIYYQMVLLTG